MSSDDNPFWRDRRLNEFTVREWESLCDGCGKCCLYKLEDADTREVYFTNVRCRLLDAETCRCGDYRNRSARVSDCITITPELLADPYWLPQTCAYRRIAEGRDLPNWHPLITGDPASVLRAGHSVCGRTVSEDEAGDLEAHIVNWIR
jgi:uncharacterized cysteine cluster protein YcgN (CxxCxxCC family)